MGWPEAIVACVFLVCAAWVFTFAKVTKVLED